MEQGTQEWLAIRLGKFTASKASAIQANGSGLETLVFEKVSEIITGVIPNGYKSADMERGNELEPEARDLYEIETGNSVSQVGFIEHSEFVGCSPDGMIGDDGMLEIKCPTDSVFLRYMYDKKINMSYYWQMQMQMWVAERKWNHYALYNRNFPKRLLLAKVLRNERDIEKIKLGVKVGIKMINEILKKVKAT